MRQCLCAAVAVIFSLGIMPLKQDIAFAKGAARRFKVESGRVEYSIGGVNNGKEVLIWDNWGENVRLHTERTILFVIPTDSLILLNGQVATYINLKEKTGVQDDISRITDLEKRKKLFESFGMDGFGEEIVQFLGGKKTGREKILGRDCDVWEFPPERGYKVWLWRGIPLMTEKIFRRDGEAPLKTIMLPEKIEIGGKTNLSDFTVPPDIQLQEFFYSSDARFHNERLEEALEALEASKKNGK